MGAGGRDDDGMQIEAAQLLYEFRLVGLFIDSEFYAWRRRDSGR